MSSLFTAIVTAQNFGSLPRRWLLSANPPTAQGDQVIFGPARAGVVLAPDYRGGRGMKALVRAA